MGAHISVPMYHRQVAQRYRLVGLRCTVCGRVNFPPRATCKYCCRGQTFEPVQLSGRGSVYTYTVIAGGGAPPEFALESLVRGRYPVAVVELEEGPRVIAQLVNVHPDEVRVGMPVEMVTRRIYAEEEVVRYGYKFAPVRQ